MEIVVKPSNIYNLQKYILKGATAFLFGMKDYSINQTSIVNIKSLTYIKKKLSKKNIKIFVSIDKNIFNEDIEPLKKILKELDNINIEGILFYDIALLSLKKELNLKTPLIWNQNFFVTNYKTCNYYEKENVKGCVLSNEITKEEINEIAKNTKMDLFLNVFGYQIMSYSKRKLVTSYFKNYKKIKLGNTHYIKDKDNKCIIREEKSGTAFITSTILNYIDYLLEFKSFGIKYIILDEANIKNADFLKVLDIANKTLLKQKTDKEEITKMFKNTSLGFLNKKTIYKVK